MKKNVLEVDTPILSHSPVTDVNLTLFKTHYLFSSDYNNITKKTPLWMISSPEYHMKRLLAADSGSIYQISHSFRNKEIGRYHNPEFTMLEWYQVSCTMKQFMRKINYFFQKIFHFDKSDYISYQKIFIQHLNIDPLSASFSDMYRVFKKLNLTHLIIDEKDINKLIEILFTLQIQPLLGQKNPLFVYNFPIAQASLAAVNKKDDRVSERFEVFFKGIELGNGFYELTDYFEQKKRFINENKKRFDMNLPKCKIDNYFLSALSHGLPPCSGIAIGLDRLIMIALKKSSINQVISFSFDRA